MVSRWSADRLVDELVRLGASGLPLRRGVAEPTERPPRAIGPSGTDITTREYLPDIARAAPLASGVARA